MADSESARQASRLLPVQLRSRLYPELSPPLSTPCVSQSVLNVPHDLLQVLLFGISSVAKFPNFVCDRRWPTPATDLTKHQIEKFIDGLTQSSSRANHSVAVATALSAALAGQLSTYNSPPCL